LKRVLKAKRGYKTALGGLKRVLKAKRREKPPVAVEKFLKFEKELKGY
jgi:hypothetical protein